MRFIVISTGLLFTIAVVGSVWADDIAALVERMREGQSQLADIQSQQNDIAAQNERDLKEFNVYKVNYDQLKAQMMAKSDSIVENARQGFKPARDIVDAYNSQCSGTLEESESNACAARRAREEPIVDRIKSRVKRELATAVKEQIDPLAAIQKTQLKAMNNLNDRIKSRFTTWQALEDNGKTLRAELEQLRTTLVDACKVAQTDESLHHCYSIGWDGARKDLPPLTNISPPFAAAPNQ